MGMRVGSLASIFFSIGRKKERKNLVNTQLTTTDKFFSIISAYEGKLYKFSIRMSKF